MKGGEAMFQSQHTKDKTMIDAILKGLDTIKVIYIWKTLLKLIEIFS